MDPPDFRVGVFLPERSRRVARENDAAKLVVPTQLDVPLDRIYRLTNPRRIVGALENVNHEPHGFDGVPRICHATRRHSHQRVVEIRKLVKTFLIAAQKHIHHLIRVSETGGDDRGIVQILSQLIEHERKDHRDTVRLCAGGNRERMRLVRTRSRESRLDVRIRFARERNRFSIARRFRKFGKRVNRESVRVDRRRAIKQRRAILVQAKQPLAFFVATVTDNKVENVRRRVEKFLASFDFVVERGECPHRAQLRPDVLVRAQNLSIVRDASANAAVVPIYSVLEPEWDSAIKQLGAVKCMHRGKIDCHFGCVFSVQYPEFSFQYSVFR